jgi:uncharacterized membrane protein YhhN
VKALVVVPFFVVAVVLLVRSRFAGNRKQELVLKPVCSALFVLTALLSLLQPSARPSYTLWITLGLLFGLGGDVALMLRTRRAFVVGLVLFLVGHLIYANLWTTLNGWHTADLVSAAVLLVAAALSVFYLRPGLGRMQGPVLLYILVICFMVNRAVSTFFGAYFSTTQAWLITAGALLFWLSDLLLAINRFRRPFKAEPAGLFLYYGGQLLIALSASYFA